MIKESHEREEKKHEEEIKYTPRKEQSRSVEHGRASSQLTSMSERAPCGERIYTRVRFSSFDDDAMMMMMMMMIFNG